MKRSSERALIECRKREWDAQLVEQFLKYGNVRKDLFGIIDVLALDDESGSIGIQACGDNDVQPHISKIINNSMTKKWLKRNNRLVLWSFRKRKFKLKNGKWSKSYRWNLRAIKFYLEDDDIKYEEIGSDWSSGQEQ